MQCLGQLGIAAFRISYCIFGRAGVVYYCIVIVIEAGVVLFVKSSGLRFSQVVEEVGSTVDCSSVVRRVLQLCTHVTPPPEAYTAASCARYLRKRSVLAPDRMSAGGP
jgi:hypothetical protein